MPKKLPIPEGWETGFPRKQDTGNYYLNGSEKTVYFWNGKEWCRATKDLFGDLIWHTRMDKQPKTNCFKLITYLLP